MKDAKRKGRARKTFATPRETEDPAGVEGVEARSEEEKFARESGLVEDRSQVGATTTGDEREIGRAGEGGREHATGHDSTIGHHEAAPLTGASSPDALRGRLRERPRDAA